MRIVGAVNIARYFLDARIEEGLGDRVALRGSHGETTYAEVQAQANRYANVLRQLGVEPEMRVVVALRDGPDYVAALFGILKVGAVVVMVNPDLEPDTLRYFLSYTRARVALVPEDRKEAFATAQDGLTLLRTVEAVDSEGFKARLAAASSASTTFISHPDDAAIWLFSGGTTGRPKAVVQLHRSFVHTTEAYAKGVIGYTKDDVTLSVPKLVFGYATGSNLLFPFSVGATAVLFPERCTAQTLFDHIERYRPTILINVPTMIGKMLDDPSASERDLSSLRLSTSAGEALPVPLHERWNETFGVDLLDGLGTAEMWHVFISNRPGDVAPGTLGRVVPGFEVRVCDDDGTPVADGEVGWLWVKGGARALSYWQAMEKTEKAFRGEWYVSGDMVVRDAEGRFTYCGRGDDMLKVSGKWLAPQEVESCLRRHPAVEEVAVVGVEDAKGLVKPCAFVISSDAEVTAEDLQEHVRQSLEPYKYPRRVVFVDDFPRTHLGKIDRGALRRQGSGS